MKKAVGSDIESYGEPKKTEVSTDPSFFLSWALLVSRIGFADLDAVKVFQNRGIGVIMGQIMITEGAAAHENA